jgi:asparagine synthetase B (glutamine-hydrolysing)
LTGEILAATDRFGSVPLFYALGPGGAVVSTELGACLQLSGVPRDVDPVAFAEMLAFDHPLLRRTLFAGVRQLPAASILALRQDGAAVHRYWRYGFYDGDAADENGAVESAGTLFKQAVSRAVPEERPVLLFVSGGLDSRLLAAELEHRAGPLRSASFGVKGSWDARYGAAVSRLCGSRQHIDVRMEPWRYVDSADDGVALTGGMLSPAHLHMYGILRRVRRPDEIVVTGFLGDPHFGADARHERNDVGEPTVEIDRLLSGSNLQSSELSLVATEDVLEAVRQDLAEVMADCVVHNLPSDIPEYFFVAERQSKLIVFISALCAAVEEVRMPFADADLAEFLCGLPCRWRYQRRLEKEMLLRVYPKYAAIPQSDTGTPLGCGQSREAATTVLRKGRRAFQVGVDYATGGRLVPPYPRWAETHGKNLRSDFRGWVRAGIAGLEERGLLNAEAAEYFEKPLRANRYDMSLFRLISTETALRWAASLPGTTRSGRE